MEGGALFTGHRERERERGRERERESEKEGGREREIKNMSRIVILIFKRNDGCLGTF